MKTGFKFTILLLLLTFGVNNTYSQQESQFTQYMYNTISVNPAYAGSRDVLSVLGLYRTQWVGLEGAPKTATFALHSPVSEKIGLGLSVINDKIGPSDENNISADLSYNIQLSRNYRLFFGVKGSANILNIDYTKLDIYNSLDPKFQNNVDNKFSPNVGAGAYLHSEKGYLGLSVPFMLETKHYNSSSNSEAVEKMHFYFIGGYVFELSNNIKFKPAILTKMVSGAPLQADLSANFLFNEKFTLGAAYRWDAAVSGMVGFQISPGLLAGYAYDLDTTKLGNYNSGSHELFLRFEVFKRSQSVYNPRFF
ncbi:PorP/SprF family type IX secretion system membrane protein [Flavobacterium urocaniciphilum]|uniref:Type IX secretion system membrane protein, PorP/SprF family n=2 Tax=Flavobacterium urocaniciphilum TaxID=1299341 RepID=A0A1H8ZPP8_9FLAO|nr:type IX secretion system membrane protein, PorP/SprF family [Flavobacterium urocaniciphilum]